MQNVRGIEKADDMVMYRTGTEPPDRMCLTVVFAACTYLEDLDGRSRGSGWFEEETKEGDPQ